LSTGGGNPNAAIGKEKIPLLAVAIIGAREDAVRYLIANGADVNAKVYLGASLLDLAESMGNDAITELLEAAAGTRT
jgi:ankyrin repeat protein